MFKKTERVKSSRVRLDDRYGQMRKHKNVKLWLTLNAISPMFAPSWNNKFTYGSIKCALRQTGTLTFTPRAIIRCDSECGLGRRPLQAARNCAVPMTSDDGRASTSAIDGHATVAVTAP